MAMTPDELAIREIVEAWAVARDSGFWDRLLSLWHPDGRMRTTWFLGPAAEFVAGIRRNFDEGVIAHHLLGGSMIDVVGDRSIAQTKSTIGHRSEIGGVLCDIECTGRFYDFFERREGRWGIVLRQAIYEKDRADPAIPGEVPVIDRELLQSYPMGCRWLLYAQHQAGLPVNPHQAGLRGPEVTQLYEDGARWLEGHPAPTD